MTMLIVLVLMAFSPKNKHTVSGIITDENNIVVNGATVRIKERQEVQRLTGPGPIQYRQMTMTCC